MKSKEQEHLKVTKSRIFSPFWIESPANKSRCSSSPDLRLIGIIRKVLLHAHTSILPRLLLQVLFPGLFRQNLEDCFWGRPSFTDLPASHVLELHAFNHSNIRRDREEWFSPILSRTYQLLNIPEVLRIIAQEKSTVDFGAFMQRSDGPIVLICLSASVLGEGGQRFLGALLSMELFHAAFLRDEREEADKQLVSIYIDEFALLDSAEFEAAFERLRKRKAWS